MTLQQALDIADEMKPNMMSRQTKIHFLTVIEQLIHQEVIMKHEHTAEQETLPEYTEETLPGTELLIPDPYSDVYWRYIIKEIDNQNQEDTRFNIDNVRFENAYLTMCDWYNRTVMPIMRNREIHI